MPDINDPGYRKQVVNEDICPECGGDLDTGWECNDCGYDAKPEAYTDLDRARDKRKLKRLQALGLLRDY